MLAHVVEREVTKDAGVGNDCVEAAVGVHGQLDHVVAVFEIADVAAVGDSVSAHRLDFVDDLLRRGVVVVAVARNTTAEVIDDDLGAMLCEVERVCPAEAAACTGYKGDLPIQTNCHVGYSSGNLFLSFAERFDYACGAVSYAIPRNEAYSRLENPGSLDALDEHAAVQRVLVEIVVVVVNLHHGLCSPSAFVLKPVAHGRERILDLVDIVGMRVCVEATREEGGFYSTCHFVVAPHRDCRAVFHVLTLVGVGIQKPADLGDFDATEGGRVSRRHLLNCSQSAPMPFSGPRCSR